MADDHQHNAIAALERTGALLTGHFLLSSGLHSDRYCQCARLFEHPTESATLAAMMASTIRAARIHASAVLSPALGGVLWGYELARALGIRTIFAERESGAKFELRRGFTLAPGERVICAEDVITTGGSILEAAALAESHGATIAAFASVVDRSGEKFKPSAPFFALAKLDFETHQPAACPMCARGDAPTKPGSRKFAGAAASGVRA